MKTNLMTAKELLLNNGYTCVLYKDKRSYTSTERGVKPLLQWLDEEIDCKGFCAADKVVGKAAAFLYVLLGVEEIYAPVISEGAKGILKENGIRHYYDLSVKAIRNRINTGFCPMEETVKNINTPEEAVTAIKLKWKELENKVTI